MVVPSRQTPPPRAEDGHRALRRIAVRQLERADTVAERIYEALTAEVPEYGAITDERLARDVRQVSAAGVRLWLDTLRRGAPPVTQDFEPIREGARRRARQGFDHYALLRAWRIAIRVMWSELIHDPEGQNAAVRQVLPEAAEEAMGFSDQVSLAVTDAYLLESSLAAREHERQRSVLLELILSHPEEAAGLQPPVEFERDHVVVVAETEDLPLSGLDHVGADLERGAGAAFWTVRSQAVVAVIPVGSVSTRENVRVRLEECLERADGVREVGIGGLASGVAETRQSYLEAVEALSHGRAFGMAGPVFDIADFGGYALMLSDPERARRFIAAALRPLQLVRPTPWLEPTLEAYISRQGRIKEAALALGVHPNTVKYRIGTLRGSLGGLLRDTRAAEAMLTALRLRRLLDQRRPAG